MPRALAVAIFLIFLQATLSSTRPLGSPDSGGVLRQLSFASFTGTGNSVQAVATDANGNVYVTGTTAGGFPVKNAAQPNFGDARILRTTDLGVTWTRVGSPPSDVGIVAVDPAAPAVLFAAAFAGIYKSEDGGQTWGVVYGKTAPGYYPGDGTVGLVIDPGNHLRVAALVQTSGPLRSTDGGNTWTPIIAPCGTFCGRPTLLADPTGSGALLVAVPQGLFLSQDWGVTFQQLTPPGNGGISTAAFDPSHRGWIYAGTSLGVSGTLSLSMDFGATWTAKASLPTVFSAIYNLAVDPDQPNTLVAAAVDGFYKSTDGAASWTRQMGHLAQFSPETAPDNPQSFALVSHACSSSGGLFSLGSGGGASGSFQVAFSPNDGVTWATPQFTHVNGVIAGRGCGIYVTRQGSSDTFVAKVAPDGSTAWATYLGGSDQDAPVALVVDAEGSAYILGNTTSPDFPVTAPRIGTPGQTAVFVTKFSPDGELAYSVLIGGDAVSKASALAADANGNVYVVGSTNSTMFPMTPGAVVTQLDAGSYTGFLVKLAADATLADATYLGPSYTVASAILIDGNQVILAGTGAAPGLPPPQGSSPGFLLKLDPATLHVVSATNLPGASPTSLAADAQGNLFLAGNSGLPITPGAYTAQSSAACSSPYYLYSLQTGSGVHIMKLAATDWTTIYSALLAAPCGIQSGAMAVDSAGAVVLGLATGNGLSLHNPLLAGPACDINSSAVAKISADGSALQFATYLDSCGVPGIAFASDGSIYAGASPSRRENPAGVLRLNTRAAPPISLDGIANTFSGDDTAVVGGGLYKLTGAGFGATTIDLGLNASHDLPFQLGGVQVTFDGIPAAILQTSLNRVIVVPPASLPAFTRGSSSSTASNFGAPRSAFTAVRLSWNGISSNTTLMPVSTLMPGLLSMDYPNPRPNPSYENYPDAIAYNQDGTQNDKNHPAPLGSTITVYVTGMGATNPPVAPGSIARSDTIMPVSPVYSSWIPANPFMPPAKQSVSSLPGFVSALLQVKVQVPDSVQSLGGTDVGNGVQRVPFGLRVSPPITSDIPIASNIIGVYVK
jgi:uncharacterized protein (TIGR03437 family)